MNYILRLRLCGYTCDECYEPLSNVTVRLYSYQGSDAATVAAADPKHTFAQLTQPQLQEKADRLLAQGSLDAEGRIDLHLDDLYDGGAFDVDIEVFGQNERDSFALHLTTLAPTWRQTEDGIIAVWDHCLSSRIWCYIRSLIDSWVICGQVVFCETQRPISGVKVTAFDRDLLQDDTLGSAVTDINGQFRIEYTRADFRPGTWADIELIGGPDVYFHVHHTSGAPLLIEPPSKGRETGRENIGHCFCVTLCLGEDVPPPDGDYPPPVFTHVGSYNHQTQIDSAPGGTGLTSADSRAFYGSIRLNGTLPKEFAGGQMEYRFDVRELHADGTPLTGWSSVDIAQIGRTVIGQLLIYAPAFPGDPNPIKSSDYTVNGNPGELEATVVDGWIRVPQESDAFSPSGYFQPNNNQIVLNTVSLGGWTDIDLTGLVTGNSSTSTGQALAQNRYFALRMRVRRVGNTPADLATEQVAGICQQIAINNTQYTNILHHPAWMPENVPVARGVAMVDIQQLMVGGGCVGIGNDLDVRFTAAHPTLGSVSISMSGPGGPYSFALPGAVPGERFGTATPSGFVVANLAPCAYIVTLSVQLLLTTGDSIPDNINDQIAFCKV